MTPTGPSTADRILDAAEALFAQHGFAGTAVRDIAAAVGINAASLYNHFESKQALYEAVLERGIQPVLEALRGAAASELAPDWGDAIIETVMAQLAERPHLPRLVQHEAVSGGEHLVRIARRWILPAFAEARTAVKQQPRGAAWDDDDLPLLVSAWLNIIFGHFAMAPLLAELIGEDPLSPEMLERQTRFLKELGRRLSTRGDPPDAAE
ncbi:MAG: TetR family transcriptional regulator [Myxococcota bacterium]|nr:TetR family transcriptional regulator [Myxococcota bacterium]